jgi:ATP-dependent DNA helicase RecQ
VGEPLLQETVDTDMANAAALFLRRSHIVIEPRKRFQKDAFPEYDFPVTISSDIIAREGRALALWGDAGWGQMVKEGKFEAGRFSDELVDGCLQMIEGWDPEPSPTWATCVPSLKRPGLVPDFAANLAAQLGIPFVQCVKKVKENRPQKEMQNSFMQANNLDGVFEIDESQMLEGPAFLIDDMVDSRWTFTVITVLLRRSGCPAVFPLALAMSSPRIG